MRMSVAGLTLANFSEGERVLLTLQAIIGLAKSEHIIALDEADNFLAPSEVQPLYRSLTVDSPHEPGPQLFVVTHHPGSIDYLASYATWLFERREDGLARARRLEFDREAGQRTTDALLAELASELTPRRALVVAGGRQDA